MLEEIATSAYGLLAMTVFFIYPEVL